MILYRNDAGRLHLKPRDGVRAFDTTSEGPPLHSDLHGPSFPQS